MRICQTVSATCLIIKNWDICCQTIYTHGVPILSVPSTKRAIMPGYHLSEETLRLPEEQNCPQHQRRKTRRLGGGTVRGDDMTWWSKWKPGSHCQVENRGGHFILPQKTKLVQDKRVGMLQLDWNIAAINFHKRVLSTVSHYSTPKFCVKMDVEEKHYSCNCVFVACVRSGDIFTNLRIENCVIITKSWAKCEKSALPKSIRETFADWVHLRVSIFIS